jgi:hypothetical protein
MFALYMNPVTANAEHYLPVAISEMAERLEQLLGNEKCDGYSDGHYYRQFREGPLHNFNPPTMDGRNCFGVNEGIVEVVGEEDLRRQHEEEMQMWADHFSTAVRV